MVDSRREAPLLGKVIVQCAPEKASGCMVLQAGLVRRSATESYPAWMPIEDDDRVAKAAIEGRRYYFLTVKSQAVRIDYLASTLSTWASNLAVQHSIRHPELTPDICGVYGARDACQLAARSPRLSFHEMQHRGVERNGPGQADAEAMLALAQAGRADITPAHLQLLQELRYGLNGHSRPDAATVLADLAASYPELTTSSVCWKREVAVTRELTRQITEQMARASDWEKCSDNGRYLAQCEADTLGAKLAERVAALRLEGVQNVYRTAKAICGPNAHVPLPQCGLTIERSASATCVFLTRTITLPEYGDHAVLVPHQVAWIRNPFSRDALRRDLQSTIDDHSCRIVEEMSAAIELLAQRWRISFDAASQLQRNKTSGQTFVVATLHPAEGAEGTPQSLALQVFLDTPRAVLYDGDFSPAAQQLKTIEAPSFAELFMRLPSDVGLTPAAAASTPIKIVGGISLSIGQATPRSSMASHVTTMPRLG